MSKVIVVGQPINSGAEVIHLDLETKGGLDKLDKLIQENKIISCTETEIVIDKINRGFNHEVYITETKKPAIGTKASRKDVHRNKWKKRF